ncbi:MAG: RNA polymerase factor sigma-54 [Rhodospirillales bacterium]
MALTPRLELRQSQSLVMTPQLQQAIKLLQLSNLELKEYVEQELEKNPLLETGEDITSDPDEVESGPASSQDPEDPETADGGGLETVDTVIAKETTTVVEENIDADQDDPWNNSSSSDSFADDMSLSGLGETAFSEWGSRGGGGFDVCAPNLEETVSDKISLRGHLTNQLSMAFVDPVDRLIALHLIDMLDESGYVGADLSLVTDTLNCDIERVEVVLDKLQNFDPTGIFARDLAECLGLQLRELDRLDPAMQALLENLDRLADHDIKGLTELCGVDAEDIADMISEIRSLNPKPALAYDFVVAQPIIPDVLMRPRSGTEWIVELNNNTLPRVLVDNHYYSRISREARSKEEKSYISECLQSANWLVKSLHQRATTILKVATEIVRQQNGFFIKGVQHLRPLVLRDIAEAIEMHESTVSRVTSNKYIATPRGIFELKYFFTPAIGSSSGGSTHSAESVRHRIKALIDAEEAKKTLSDDKIVEILRKEDIDIARRTVAKYREAMGISSSVKRRREKANPL